MSIHKTIYALDTETKDQYAIVFNHGKPTIIPASGENGSVFANTTRTAISDELQPTEDADGKQTLEKMVFTITFDSNGKASDLNVDFVDKSTPTPAHHATPLANIARQKMEGGGNPLGQSNGGWSGQQAQRRPQPQNPVQRTPRTQTTTPVPANNTTPVAKPPRRAPPANTRPSVNDATIENLLKKYGVDLTERAYQGKLDPIIGRDKDLDKLKQYLLRKKRSNVNVIGEAGVGKTAMFDALALDIVNGNAEAELAGARVISLNLQEMNAGTQFRGEFEKRIVPILKGLEERGGYLKGQKVVLCIDEIHSALTAGQAQGGTNAGEIMKPYLAREGLSCIGATTMEEYKKFIEENKALDRRFQPLYLDEPSVEDTILILKGLSDVYEEYHALENNFSDAQLEKIVNLTDRYMTKFQHPDKDIGIIDDAGAIARKEGRESVTDSDILRAVSKAANIPETILMKTDEEKYLNLADDLKKVVLGQEDAIDQICARLTASCMDLNDPNQPAACFLFQGPTGVGKTFLAKQLGKHLNGNEKIEIISMGKYKRPESVSGLIGSPPGFEGSKDNNAELTEPVRENPFSIVVLDEIEKATYSVGTSENKRNDAVFDLFLNILEEGEIKDAVNRKVSFRNTIIIMTSNLGAQELSAFLSGSSNRMGMATPGDDQEQIDKSSPETKEKIESINKAARNKFFSDRPEFLGRVEATGGCITFNNLPKDIISNLVMEQINEVTDRLQKGARGLELKDASVTLSRDVQNSLAEVGYGPMGVRQLKSAIQSLVIQPLALHMLENKQDLLKKSKDATLKFHITGIGKDFNVKVQKKKEKAAVANQNKPAKNTAPAQKKS